MVTVSRAAWERPPYAKRKPVPVFAICYHDLSPLPRNPLFKYARVFPVCGAHLVLGFGTHSW